MLQQQTADRQQSIFSVYLVTIVEHLAAFPPGVCGNQDQRKKVARNTTPNECEMNANAQYLLDE